MFPRLCVTIITNTTLLLLSSSLTFAATKKPQPPDKFPPNPLEITVPDPLNPRSPKDTRPLTSEERQTLEVALEELNQQAAAKLAAGDKISAFEIWNRELRLRRFLGQLAEVQALSRVGAIAWNANDRQEVQYITQRLQTVQKQSQTQKTADLEFLQALGQAYQQVRSSKLALVVYDQILASVRQQGDAVAEVNTLKTIGSIHLGWFDYPSAAAIYEKLLAMATSQGDRANELLYLQQLAYIYEQAKQPENSLKARNQLAKIYQNEKNFTQIPDLKQEIATDYEALAKENPSLLQQAFRNYQAAYMTAWDLQQYVRAGEILRKLIALYRSQGQVEEALQASQILLQAEQLSSNSYGLMTAYDEIGQIYIQRKDYPQALQAFKKGLEIAQQLQYNEEYFTQQIQKVSGQSVK
ncbi:tetratricopeptide repeat protein [Scytonema sp. NUACC26]|uniref:tetratricopeptide repeat protein n=1 Tax=Scytonema sp. NUACC26 TaxID=3140176 RepID=UPI0034DC22B9